MGPGAVRRRGRSGSRLVRVAGHRVRTRHAGQLTRHAPAFVPVRDSRNPTGPVIPFSREDRHAFVAHVGRPERPRLSVPGTPARRPPPTRAAAGRSGSGSPSPG
ncbi:DUF397 domain-containing protein [Streptomyces sp. NK08204]|uniref:DUF397 domain-containing protein n=1 Tax=Streptomyces sp. NK08204 TaxID=2873260 RepID=UPI001CECE226